MEEVKKEESNEEKKKGLSFDKDGNPVSEDGSAVVISKEDLESISRQFSVLTRAQASLGELELKKIELASQILGLKKNQDAVFQSILEKYGIPPQEVTNFGVNQKTGQILRSR